MLFEGKSYLKATGNLLPLAELDRKSKRFFKYAIGGQDERAVVSVDCSCFITLRGISTSCRDHVATVCVPSGSHMKSQPASITSSFFVLWSTTNLFRVGHRLQVVVYANIDGNVPC